MDDSRAVMNEIAATRARRKGLARAAMEQFAAWMKEELRQVGMSQQELSAQLESSPDTVWRISKAKPARFSTMAEIAAALGYQITLDFSPLSETA